MLEAMQYGLPAGRAYLRRFVEKALEPTLKKQSNTMYYLPGVGRTSILRYLSGCREMAQKELEIDLGKMVWLLVDSNDEKRVLADWGVMLEEQGVAEGRHETTGMVLGELVKTGRRIVLSARLGEGGPTAGQLATYRSVSSPAIDFHFCLGFEQTTSELARDLGELGQFALQNVWYLSLYEKEDMERVIENQVREGFARVDQVQVEEIVRLSGGYARYARYFLRHPDKLGVGAWEEGEVRLFSEDLWQALGTESRRWLMQLSGGRAEGEPTGFLKETGMVRQGGSGYGVFSPLFEEYLKYIGRQAKPTIEEAGGEMWVGESKAEGLLSPLQLKVLKFLWERRGKIVSREEISEVIWGPEVERAYSDWAINQLIRRLRVRIGDVKEDRRVIETVRDRGFILQVT